MTEAQTIDLLHREGAIALAGAGEENLKTIQRQTGAVLVLHGQELRVSGTANQIELCQRLVRSLEPYWNQGKQVSSVDILAARHALDTNQQEKLRDMQQNVVARTLRGEEIVPKTFRQQQYVRSLRTHDITFCIGPAGTGKTYLAVLAAAQGLLDKEYERIILTRPAVEAGERLGFLPGDLQQKVNPYLRPLFDALHEVLRPEKVQEAIEKGIIEVAPIAYMRGRTLSHCFVILDEAQNTTPAQMKMVLTRLGARSRMAIAGDATQSDLASGQMSGLSVAQKILAEVEGIAFCYLTAADVVRNPLVQRIVAAYEKYDKSKGEKKIDRPFRS